MKKILIIFSAILLTGTLQAKKVKFAVDMSGQTISPNGVHIMGDFQALAGLGTDWNPATATLTQEGSTNIYSIIVNIPAFRKYEYRFLNGDQTYEAEFVPEKSRVDEFIDNRWLYVDSLANDTTYAGAILFAANAPAGKKLLRYRIDLRTLPQSGMGIHVGTSYQNTPYSPIARRMYDITSGIYEIIDYVNNGTYNYIFYNGNVVGAAEIVPATCSVNGKRSIALSTDSVINLVCFSSCASCVGVGIAEHTAVTENGFYPNPSADLIHFNGTAVSVEVTDLTGRVVLSKTNLQDNKSLDIRTLGSGMYLLRLQGHDGSMQTSRLQKI